MEINRIIKEKRLLHNLTQEQLANQLGISTPAVNKWEKGVSYPDITLLSPLARLLDIDLNILFSFDKDLTDKEIHAFIESSCLNLNQKNYKQIFRKCMDKIHEYPNSVKLIINICMALTGGLYIINIKNKELFEDELHQLYHQCAISDDVEVKNQAIPYLIGINIQKSNYEKAQSYINMLPSRVHNKDQYQGGLYVATQQYEKALELFEGNLLKLSTEIYTVLISMMGVALKENKTEQAKHLASVIEKTTTLYDMWDYNAYSAYFDLYSYQQDENNLIDTLEKMLSSFSVNFSLQGTSLYNHIRLKEISENTKSQFIISIVETIKTDIDGNLAFIKNNPRFIELLNKYS